MTTYADPAATVRAAFDALEKRYQAICADVQKAQRRRELQAVARVVISAYEHEQEAPTAAPPPANRAGIGVSPLWEFLATDPTVEDEQPKRKRKAGKGKGKVSADPTPEAAPIPRPASPVWWIGLPPTPKPARVSILQGLATLGDWNKPERAPKPRTHALTADAAPKKRGRPRKQPAEAIPAA